MSYKTVVAYSRSEAELKRVLSAIGLLRQKVPDIHVIGLYAIPSPIVYADPNGFIDPGDVRAARQAAQGIIRTAEACLRGRNAPSGDQL